MIVFDTETTDLTLPEVSPLDSQPYIIEYAAIKLNDKTLKEIDRLEFVCKPPIRIPAFIEKLTGITNKRVQDEHEFAFYYDKLFDFCSGEKIWVAHNAQFDLDIMKFSLRRLGKEHAFPYPKRHICTVQETLFIDGARKKLSYLYELATGKELVDAHRAMADVEGLVAIIKWLRKEHGAI